MKKLILILMLLAMPAWAAEPNKEAQKIEEKVVQLSAKIEAINQEIHAFGSRLDETATLLEKMEEKEETLREKLHEQLETFNSTTQSLLRVERMPLQAIVMAENLRGGSARLYAVKQGKASLKDRMAGLREELASLQTLHAEKREAQAKIIAIQERLLRKREKLEPLFLEHLALLESHQSRKARSLKKAFKDNSKAIEETYGYLSQSKRIANAKDVTYRILPVNGHVIRHFRQKDATGLPAYGITIESSAGASVKAPKGGTVVYSGPFKDYGYIVILEHRDGVNSLYSGLKGSSLKAGDKVSKNQTLGLLPADENPTLYVEVRKAGKIISPRRWL